MDVVTIDFETYWSATHSLTKMNPIAYVMHPETEVQSMAVKLYGHDTAVLFGEDDIQAFFDSFDLSNAILVGHNMSGFDAMVAAWRFGANPKMWGCTLAMARQCGYAKTVGLSLKKTSSDLGLGDKLSLEATNTKGKYLEDFTPDELDAMAEYNRVDTDLCYGIFKKLAPRVGNRSLDLIDTTIRMLVEPAFETDVPLLKDTLREAKDRARRALLDVAETLDPSVSGLSDEDKEAAAKTILGSTPKFVKFLQSKGAPVPMKPSPSNPDKQIPALSKTDAEFVAMQEYEDLDVAMAVSARLGVKSTILQSRIESFLEVAEYMRGAAPIALSYYGADTTGRWSGMFKLNQQNLPRINPKNPQLTDALRNCLRAPEGYKVVVADLSGIELRVNHFLWKVVSSMELFNLDPEDADLYKDFAATLYEVPVDAVNSIQRQVGKVAQLGLGFGAGHRTFQKVAKVMGGVDLDEEESATAVRKWRLAYPEIRAGWQTCHKALDHIANGRYGIAIDPWGLCTTMEGGIKTPQGAILYPELRYETNEEGGGEWVYGVGRNKTRIYAGKVTENCIAEGTLVLTQRGWVPIESVLQDDLVHDGVEFVSHKGTLFKGVQECVTVDGVYMTDDHEVLTNDGWKTASQLQGHNSSDLWRIDSGVTSVQPEGNMEVDLQMQMRQHMRESRNRRSEGPKAPPGSELRVPDKADTLGEAQYAWDVEAPSVCGMEKHAGQVQASNTPSMGKLRRAWDSGVQTVASLRAFLGRHGVELPTRADTRPDQQRRGLHPDELPMGYSQTAGYEQTQLTPGSGYTGVIGADGDFEVHPVLPHEAGATANRSSRQKKSYKVYDIVNAGQRQRFVVMGDTGPFVVHNCVQHLAREIISDMTLRIKHSKIGKLYPLAHTVHDELVYVVKEQHAQVMLDIVLKVMRDGVDWWPELVTWAKGDFGDTYGECK